MVSHIYGIGITLGGAVIEIADETTKNISLDGAVLEVAQKTSHMLFP